MQRSDSCQLKSNKREEETVEKARSCQIGTSRC